MTRHKIHLRRGKFAISIKELDQNPEEIIRVFELLKVVVLRAEYMYPDEVEYIGVSPNFDELEINERCPEYSIHISKECEEGGVPEISKVEAVRI